MKTKPASPDVKKVLRKLALYGGIGLLLAYLGVVAASYAWLHYGRKNDHVRLLDVALGRVGAVRRSLAAQHFINAQKSWDEKKFQDAYLLFSAAVRQDPDNIPGRLAAAKFLRSVGAGSLALIMLEEGLTLAPDDQRLIEATFDFLLASGRDRRGLEMLKRRYPNGLTGKNSGLLQRYEVEMTFSAEGAPAAKRLLERYPALLQMPAATPVIARICWETQEQVRAIGLLQGYVQTAAAAYADSALLANWQSAVNRPEDAIQTARQAIAKFPQILAARVLLIETLLAQSPTGLAGQEAITAYMREFSGRSEALVELAALGGRKGWVGMNQILYEVGASRQADLRPLALSFCDALARESRYAEIRQILNQLEAQTSDENPAFMVQLRQRQVIASAATGDSDSVREYARRLGSLLGRDPDAVEVCRRLFGRLGIADAVSELTPRSAKPAPAPAPKKPSASKQT